LTYLSAEKIARLEHFAESASKRVEGSIAEFGVAIGGSAIILATLAKKRARYFHGLDVFEMIPPPGPNDGDDVHKRYETIRSGQSAGIGDDVYYGYREHLLTDVRNAFSRYGLHLSDRIQLHKGLFQGTWREIEDPIIAFAHVDCDWFEPVTFCLEALHQRVRSGSIVLLDDYHDFSGARRATDAFVGRHQGLYAFHDGPNVALERL
jgi:O-methyltransferase